MTDRELLVMAAKAAGLPLSSEWDSAAHGILIGHGDGDLQLWNPLFHDGDALRLAVKLDILELAAAEVVLSCNQVGDPYENTRRAIVRSAAEIGR